MFVTSTQWLCVFTGRNQARSVGARVRLEPNLGLILNKGYEGQLKVYTIPQLFLRLRLVKRSVITLDRPGPRFLKVETSLNSCLRSGVAAGISLGYLAD